MKDKWFWLDLGTEFLYNAATSLSSYMLGAKVLGLPEPAAWLVAALAGPAATLEVCVIGTPVGCDDGNPCTADLCQLGGCVHTPLIGAPCDDGNACTVGDRCGDGACRRGAPRDCDDDDLCTRDACSVTVGCVHAAIPGCLTTTTTSTTTRARSWRRSPACSLRRRASAASRPRTSWPAPSPPVTGATPTPKPSAAPAPTDGRRRYFGIDSV